jgi:hypothetical protein
MFIVFRFAKVSFYLSVPHIVVFTPHSAYSIVTIMYTYRLVPICTLFFFFVQHTHL